VGAAVAAYDRGASVLRVHDVGPTRQALDVAAAIRLAGSPVA
jgi:dihydropteroate synthase